MYLKMAWRNIWRNKRRTLITMASIFFAVILSIIMRSTITGVFEKLINDIVGISSGYIQIHKKGYWKERSVDNTFQLTDSLVDLLNNENEIVSWAPRLESYALISSGNRTRGVMVSGINSNQENSITHLKDKLIAGEFISDTSSSILVPDALADYLRIKINDTLVLFGQGYHGSIAAAKFPVKGILKIASPDLSKSMCWLSMNSCRNFLGSNDGLTSISLLLKSEGNLEDVLLKLKKKLFYTDYEIMSWKEMLPDLHQFIQADSTAHLITIYILYIIISFGVFGTVLMMLNERYHEFGILMAIGMKKYMLSLIVFTEILIIAGMAALLGIIFAFPFVIYLHYHPIEFTGDLARAYEGYGMEPIIPTSLDLENYTSQAFIVFIISFFISLFPFYKINRLKVLKAINS